MEVAGIVDVTVENDILEKTKDVLEQEYEMNEIVTRDAKETVEDIAQILSVLKEDILDIVTGTEKNCEALTAEDLPETDPTGIKDTEFVKADENASNGRYNKPVKSLERGETRKKVCWEFGKKKHFGKVSNAGEIIKYSMSNDSNETSINEIVEKINLSELQNHYTEYQRDCIKNLKRLYNYRNLMHEFLEENSCIAQQCRFVFTNTDPTTDVNSISELELKTLNGFLVSKARVYIDCLRSLCWNLDGCKSIIRDYKKSNTNLNMMVDNILSCIFTNGKK